MRCSPLSNALCLLQISSPHPPHSSHWRLSLSPVFVSSTWWTVPALSALESRRSDETFWLSSKTALSASIKSIVEVVTNQFEIETCKVTTELNCRDGWQGLARIFRKEDERKIQPKISLMWRPYNLSNSWNSWKQQNYLRWSIWWWWQKESSKNRKRLFCKKRSLPPRVSDSGRRVLRGVGGGARLYRDTDAPSPSPQIRAAVWLVVPALPSHWPQWVWGQWIQIRPRTGHHTYRLTQEKVH